MKRQQEEEMVPLRSLAGVHTAEVKRVEESGESKDRGRGGEGPPSLHIIHAPDSVEQRHVGTPNSRVRDTGKEGHLTDKHTIGRHLSQAHRREEEEPEQGGRDGG